MRSLYTSYMLMRTEYSACRSVLTSMLLTSGLDGKAEGRVRRFRRGVGGMWCSFCAKDPSLASGLFRAFFLAWEKVVVIYEGVLLEGFDVPLGRKMYVDGGLGMIELRFESG